MKIAIDIDNTICETSLFFGKLAEEYDREVLHKNNIIDYTKIMPRSKEWTSEELKYFVDNIFNKKSLEIPIKKDVSKYIKKLKQDGNYIMFITNRGIKDDDHSDLIIEDYLRKNGIPYDEIITKSNDKYKYLENYDYFIDDSIFNCEQVLNNTRCKVILFESENTTEYKNNLLYKTDNWKDVYKYILSENQKV